MIKRSFFILCCLFSGAVCLADTTTTAVTVNTDAFPGTSYIDIVRNSSDVITAMLYRSRDGSVERFTVAQLRERFQVLKHASDRDIILLGAERDFTAEKGGHVILRFLQSGINDTYRNFRILVDNQRDIVLRSDPNYADPESDNNYYTTNFNYLFLRANRFFGKIIGVIRVEPEFKSAAKLIPCPAFEPQEYVWHSF